MSDSMRNVLLIAHSFPPSLAVGAARVSRLYRFLPECGYRVHVVTASPAAGTDDMPNVVRVPEPGRDTLKGFSERVLRKFLPNVDEGVAWVSPATAAARRILKSQPIDLIISTFPPVADHRIALRLSSNSDIPWIADFRDPLVGNPHRIPAGIGGWLDRTLERQIFDRAGMLLCTTDQVAGEWRARYAVHSSKIHVVPNGYDPDEELRAKPIPPRPYRALVHVGSLYGGRSPAAPLRSMQRLIDRGILKTTELRVRFIGDLDQAALEDCRLPFEKLAAAGTLEHVPTHIPRAEALDIMSQSEYLLIADNNRLNIGQTVPVKLLEYVRIGRPVLALTARDSPVHEILRRSGVSYVAIHNEDSEEDIDEKMIRLLNMSSEPVEASDWFRREFDGRRLAHSLAGLLDALAPRAATR